MITGRIVRAEESTDGRKSIRIIVEFSEDGAVIVPEWTLWAQMSNLLGMTKEQVSEWVRINIEHQIGNFIMERAKSSINTDLMAVIASLRERTYQTDKVDIVMEANAVIPAAYVMTINSDGTYEAK